MTLELDQVYTPLPLGGNWTEGDANSSITIAHAAVSRRCHVISGVIWSYDGDPADGYIEIDDGANNTVLGWDITASGPDRMMFNPPIKFTENTYFSVHLSAGGGAVVGKLGIIGKRIINA